MGRHRRGSAVKLHVLTAVTRPENIAEIQRSIYAAEDNSFAPIVTVHHRLYDPDRKHVGGQHLKNQMLQEIHDGWVCVLDDDTVMHPSFLYKIYRARVQNPLANAFVVSQRRTTNVVLQAKPENMVVGKVDAGQAVLRRSFVGDTLIPETYAGDGEWLHGLLFGRDDVVYLREVLSLHNALSGVDVSETPERMVRND